MVQGLYKSYRCISWEDYRREYEETHCRTLDASSRQIIESCLDSFERHMKPKKMDQITTSTINRYKSKRLTDRGKKKGSTISPSTVNKNLRHLRHFFNLAHKLKYMPERVEVSELKESKRYREPLDDQRFEKIYRACGVAEYPVRDDYAAGDWWRALMVTARLTGWRIGQIRELRMEDLQWEEGTALCRHESTKGDRDFYIRLHPMVWDHFRVISLLDDLVFPWPHSTKAMYTQWHRIQRKAGIHLTCREDHEHTPSCHVYGFHRFRFAFASQNVELGPEVLQHLMQHKSYETTKHYIEMANDAVHRAVDRIAVPPVCWSQNRGT